MIDVQPARFVTLAWTSFPYLRGVSVVSVYLKDGWHLTTLLTCAAHVTSFGVFIPDAKMEWVPERLAAASFDLEYWGEHPYSGQYMCGFNIQVKDGWISAQVHFHNGLPFLSGIFVPDVNGEWDGLSENIAGLAEEAGHD